CPGLLELVAPLPACPREQCADGIVEADLSAAGSLRGGGRGGRPALPRRLRRLACRLPAVVLGVRRYRLAAGRLGCGCEPQAGGAGARNLGQCNTCRRQVGRINQILRDVPWLSLQGLGQEHGGIGSAIAERGISWPFERGLEISRCAKRDGGCAK